MKQRKVTRQAATGNQTQDTLACAASGLPLIDEKPVVHLSLERKTLGTAFIDCRVRQAMYAIRGKTTS